MERYQITVLACGERIKVEADDFVVADGGMLSIHLEGLRVAVFAPNQWSFATVEQEEPK